MDSHVLFEASFFDSGILLLLCWAGVFTFAIFQAVKTEKRRYGKKDARAGAIIGAAIALLCVLFLILLTASHYRGTLMAYRRGEYLVAEGYVENFCSVEQTGFFGKDSSLTIQESFTINGVAFHYGPRDLTHMFGYRSAWPYKGIITGDGQHLRIGYIPNTKVIVYIEELPRDS